MGSEIWKPNHFEIRTNGHHSVKNDMKSGQKSQDFEWSVFGMVGTSAIA